MSTLLVRGPARVSGTRPVPGDKSISHRALLFAGVAAGTSRLRGLGPGEDVAATRRCLEAYGVRVHPSTDGLEVAGGIDAWREPGGPLDCGNSGTTMRLLAGLAARRPFTTILDGDASLRRRPMDRIADPLRRLGGHVRAREDRLPPIEISGGSLVGASITTKVASAQVKSCVLLAGLGAEGTTTLVEPAPSRDHTERLLTAMGAPIRTWNTPDGGVRVEIEAHDLPPVDLTVPGDLSSAAFLVAAAILCGEVRVPRVGLNPTRTGFLDTVSRMGARLERDVTEEHMGEPVGALRAERSDLRGVRVDPDTIPIALVHDELPLVAVLATTARGRTEVTGAGELRVKESDRITAIAEGLSRLGAAITERPDGFVVDGPTPLRGALVDAHGDHRVAMALAVAGLVASGETRIDGFEAAAVSWPDFADGLTALGADMEVVDG